MTKSTESSLGSKIKEAGKHSLVYGLGSVAQSAVGLALLPILTGSLTPNDFGVYSLVLMASSVASAIFYLGMTSALPRSYFDYQSEEDRRAVFTTAFVVLVLGAAAQSAFGQLGGSLISRMIVGNSQYADAVAWAFFASAISFVNQYFFTYLRILRKSIVSVVFSLVGLPGAVGLTLLMLSWQPGDLSAPFKAIAFTQLAIAIMFLALYGRQALLFRMQWDELSRLISFGAGSVLASFGSILLDWADRLIVGHYLTLSDVGSYSAAVRIGTLINIILISPFAQIWSPMMMEYRTHSNIKELYSKVFYYFLLIGFATVSAACLFVEDLLPWLIHSAVSQSMIVVVVLVMMAALVYGTTNIVSAGLMYERRVLYFSYVYYAVAFFKIGINILAIPALGIVGAAMSTLIASIMVPVGIYALSKRFFSFEFEWTRLAVLTINMVPPLAYGLFLGESYPLPLLLKVFWFLLICALLYVTCFSKYEKQAIGSVMRQLTVR